MQIVEFWLELISELNRPSLHISMPYSTYAVKCITLLPFSPAVRSTRSTVAVQTLYIEDANRTL